MITGIALILIACFVAMPKAIMITLCVFGAIHIAGGLITIGSKASNSDK